MTHPRDHTLTLAAQLRSDMTTLANVTCKVRVTGGAVGLLIGTVAARYGWNVSDQEATLIGAAFAAVGGVVAHLATGPGIWPGVKRAILGPKESSGK